MDDTRAARLRDKLRRLRDGDPLLRLPGACEHRHELGPRLSDAQLAAFEAAYGAALPEEYRWFLRELGDGGAGRHALIALTAQGLELDLASPSRLWWSDALPPLSAEAAAAAPSAAPDPEPETDVPYDPIDAADLWPPGESLRACLDRLRARGRRPSFDEDDASLMTRLYAAYEAEPGLRDIDTEAFEAADPGCPPEADAVPDDDDDDRPGDATFGHLGDQPTLVFHRRYESFLRGSLPFVKLDCGHHELLVVSGAEGGHVWTDTGITMSRTATSFLDWYEAWLDEQLAAVRELAPLPAATITDWAHVRLAEARAGGEDPESTLLAFYGAYGASAGLWSIVLEILEEHGTPSTLLAQCRADALLALGRFAEAERWYREADRGLSDPDDHAGERRLWLNVPVLARWIELPSPRRGLARALAAQGRSGEALRELERVPPSVDLFLEAAAIAHGLRRFDEAIRLAGIARFLANLIYDGDRGSEATALLQRGDALLRLERFDDARAAYARAADKSPRLRDPRIHHALARLEATLGDHAAAMAHVEIAAAEGADPALFDDDDLIALRDDPAHHARFTALAARAWWRRA